MVTNIKAVKILAGLFVVLTITILWTDQNCLAFLTTPFNVKYLLPRSGLVVKGKVEEIKEGETVKLHSVKYKHIIASFRIERVIKGSALVGEKTKIEFLKQIRGILSSPSETLSKGEYCIVFLMRKGENFKFADPNNSKVPALRGKVKIKFPKHSPEGILAEELINNSFSKKRKIAVVSITQLGNLGIQEAIPYLEKLERARDPVVRGRSFATRIELGNFSCISKAVHYIDQVPSNLEVERAKAGICFAIEKIRDSRVVPQLNTLTEHHYTPLRKSAVYALRFIRDRSSVPYFIKRLHDRNPDVRYDSLMGLVEVTKKFQEWAPTVGTFHKDEVQYIQRWEDWWKRVGKSQYLKK